ncbi:MAG: TonB-dependent receptor [Taibaiella sp.]|nr:TonB-dependent receptor [Taibaiella sp.]
MRSTITKFLITIIICLCTALMAQAHTGSLKGYVYDNTTHKPIEGASVYLKEQNLSAVTDAFGKFFMKGLKDGKVTLYVSTLGYKTLEQSIKIEDGVTSDLAINLEPSEVKLSEVSVNAKKDLTLSSISGLDLKLRPVNSTQDLMRLVPGLFTAEHQGGGKAEQMFLRGFDADHGTDVNVSVDGMPVNMVSHAHGQGFADTHFIIPESVQLLDFGKGPYQIDKGNLATAGWVAFKTKNTLDKSFVKVDGGTYGYFRTVVGLNLLNRDEGNHKQDAYIMGEYGYNRSYFDRSQNFQRFNLMGKYTNYLASNKILSLTLSGFSTSWDASGQIPTRAIDSGYIGRFGALDGEGGATSRYNANLQYFQTIGNNSYFKSNMYLTYYQFKLYSDFTFFAVDSINGDQIRQAEKRIMGGYNSEYGTNYSVKDIHMKTQVGLGFRYDNVMNDELSHTVDKITLKTIALGDVHETNIYGYINQTIDILPQLVLTAGTRFDYFIQQYNNKLTNDPASIPDVTFNNSAFSPKVGVYYNVSNKARIYYNYGVGFHTNDTRTLAIGSNPLNQLQYPGQNLVHNVLPLAFSHDLGIIVKPYDRLLLSAAVWLLNLQTEFTYSGDESSVSPGPRTRRQGFDLSIRYEVFKWLYIDGDMNLTKARSRDDSAGNNYLPLAASFTSIAGATFKINKSLSTSIRVRTIGDRPANQDNSIVAPAYTIFDVVANYSRPRYEFGLQVQNIFNVQWDEAAFATNTRLRQEVMSHSPAVTDLCFTPGTPLFIKLSATYKF